MNNTIPNQQSVILEMLIRSGYTQRFHFIEGLLHIESNPGHCYLMKDVTKQPIPDVEANIIAYRIETPDGIKGHAICGWHDDE